jgi:hypothetical protein
MTDRLWPWESMFQCQVDESAGLREDLDCGCRSSATCPDHLAEQELRLEHVPFGQQPKDAA